MITKRLSGPVLGLIIAGLVAGCGHQAGSEEQSGNDMSKNAQESTPVETYTVPAGATLVVSLQAPLDTDVNHQGDAFRGTLVDPVRIGETVVFPAGATVNGELTGVSKDPAEIILTATSVADVSGHNRIVDSAPLKLVEQGSTGKTAEKVAGGAVAGGVIGGILGGKKGAAIGAGAGAAAGTIVAIATKDHRIKLDSGQKVQFELQNSVQVPLPAAE